MNQNHSSPSILKILIWLGSFGLLTIYYLGVSLNIPYNSDHASIVLKAQSILDRNILLKGWTLSTVSYYTTEIPFYILGILTVGFSDKVIYIVSAVNYALLVLLIIYISSKDEYGHLIPARAFISFCLTFFITAYLRQWHTLSPVHLVAYFYILIW